MNNMCVELAECKTTDNSTLRITMDYKGWFRCHIDFIGSKTFTDHENVDQLFNWLNGVFKNDKKTVANIRRQIIDLTSDVDTLEKMRTLLTRSSMSKLRQDIYALTKVR